jgi:hypothetical protein
MSMLSRNLKPASLVGRITQSTILVNSQHLHRKISDSALGQSSLLTFSARGPFRVFNALQLVEVTMTRFESVQQPPIDPRQHLLGLEAFPWHQPANLLDHAPAHLAGDLRSENHRILFPTSGSSGNRCAGRDATNAHHKIRDGG